MLIFFFSVCAHYKDKSYYKKKYHPQPILESLKLQRNINKYDILKDTASDDEDKNQFMLTRKSLEILGFSDGDELISIFKILASILKLGNLNFVPITNIDGTEGCEISNDYGENFFLSNSSLCRQLKSIFS